MYCLCSENKDADAVVTTQLICAFVFAYPKIRFSHDTFHMSFVFPRHSQKQSFTLFLMPVTAIKKVEQRRSWLRLVKNINIYRQSQLTRLGNI